MRGDRAAKATRLVDDRLELLIGPVRPAMQFAIVADVDVAICVDLDPVGAELHLLANGATKIVRAVDKLRTRRHLDLP